MGDGGGSACSSSGEEDGDAEWRANISSITTSSSSGLTKNSTSAADSTQIDNDPNPIKSAKSGPKLYQIKAQKLLDDFLGKSLEFVRKPIPLADSNPQSVESGIRLFRKAPRGPITIDPVDSVPLKRPKLIPGGDIKEKSKKFKHQVRSVAVDGTDIIKKARDACKRSMTRLEAKDAEAKEKAKREEERIKELKKIRGEKWLPSIAREMQIHQAK